MRSQSGRERRAAKSGGSDSDRLGLLVPQVSPEAAAESGAGRCHAHPPPGAPLDTEAARAAEREEIRGRDRRRPGTRRAGGASRWEGGSGEGWDGREGASEGGRE